MIQALTILIEHPLTFGFMILCFMGFVGLTYDFILRLFGRPGYKQSPEVGQEVEVEEAPTEEDDGIVEDDGE